MADESGPSLGRLCELCDGDVDRAVEVKLAFEAQSNATFAANRDRHLIADVISKQETKN